MIHVFLPLISCLPSHPKEYYPELWHICGSATDGKDICINNSLWAFSAHFQDTFTDLKSYYVLKRSSLVFTKEFVTNTLNMAESTQKYISGKFTGIFVPDESGTYTFNATIKHAYVKDEYFFVSDYDSALIDFDVSDESTKGDLSCETLSGEGCSSTMGTITNCMQCIRTVKLNKGDMYPLYCGVLTQVGLLYDRNLSIDLVYKAPSSSVWSYVSVKDDLISDDSVDNSSPSAEVGSDTGSTITDVSNIESSRSSKNNTFIIIGAVSGVLLVIIVIVVSLWVFLRRRNYSPESKKRSSSHSGHRKGKSQHQRSKSSRR